MTTTLTRLLGLTLALSLSATAIAAPLTAVTVGQQDKIFVPSKKLTLVNIWATWCGPCIEEFPHFVEIQNKYKDKGLQVSLISADFPTEEKSVKAFLKKHRVEFESYMIAGSQNDFIKKLGKDWAGSIPATFLFDSKKKLLWFYPKKVSKKLLQDKIKEFL